MPPISACCTYCLAFICEVAYILSFYLGIHSCLTVRCSVFAVIAARPFHIRCISFDCRAFQAIQLGWLLHWWGCQYRRRGDHHCQYAASPLHLQRGRNVYAYTTTAVDKLGCTVVHGPSSLGWLQQKDHSFFITRSSLLMQAYRRGKIGWMTLHEWSKSMQ